MSLDIGVRLVRAGVITRVQLAETLTGDAIHSGGSLVRRLMQQDVSPQAIAELLESEGFAPRVSMAEITRADPNLIAMVPAKLAYGLRALPIEQAERDVKVAMSDPSDRHAVRDLEHVLSARVQPLVAFEQDVATALEHWYPAVPEDLLGEGFTYRGSGPGASLAAMGETHARTQSRQSFPHASVFSGRETGSYDVRQSSNPRTSEESWMGPLADAKDPLGETQRYHRQRKSTRPARGTNSLLGDPEVQQRPAALGSTLDRIRASASAHEVAQLVSDAVRSVARCCVFLRYQHGGFVGWAGSNEDMSADFVNSIHISPEEKSTFQRVLVKGKRYIGPLGMSPVDVTFGQNIRGGTGIVVIEPIIVKKRLIAMVCADEVRFSDVGKQRVEVLTKAATEAFERLLRRKD